MSAKNTLVNDFVTKTIFLSYIAIRIKDEAPNFLLIKINEVFHLYAPKLIQPSGYSEFFLNIRYLHFHLDLT